MTGKWHGGKGDTPRKRQVSNQQWSDNYDLIWGKKDEEEDVGEDTDSDGTDKEST